jgi:DNA-binding NarL/FixJ family response regulator
MGTVADSKNLNLLAVEDDLEDEQLLCEALIEIEENRQWCNWRGASIVQVDQLSDALDCLRRQPFDVVLLNLSLPDSPVLLDTFLEAHAMAQGAPIIVLADEEDENLANRLIRSGADDVLLKSELECSLLARSIRYAVERQRRSLEDQVPGPDVTGVLSKLGLAFVAPHVLRLAVSSHIDTHLAILEIAGLPAATSEQREARELFLMRAADVLQDTFPAPVLIGRAGKCRFALILAGPSYGAAEVLVARAAQEIEEILQRLVAATVNFSVNKIVDVEGLEVLLNDSKREAEPLWCAKPVMLAD